VIHTSPRKAVPLQDYETIPQEFRTALETAFPNLINYTPEVEEFAPFEPEFDAPAGDLIPVDTSTGEPRTDARTLHASLGSRRDFSNWCKQRVEECDLVENQDYGVCSPNLASKPRGGHKAIDYWLTLDAAKEMAMMERNEPARRSAATSSTWRSGSARSSSSRPSTSATRRP
jgi:phage anti-repressor protein